MALRHIMLMNMGFFGIQYSFGLQQSTVNSIFAFLNANPEQLPETSPAGSIIGLRADFAGTDETAGGKLIFDFSVELYINAAPAKNPTLPH